MSAYRWNSRSHHDEKRSRAVIRAFLESQLDSLMPQPFKHEDHHHVQQATTTRNWIPSGDVVRRGDQPRERSMFGENNIRRSCNVSAAPPFQQVPSFRRQDPSARRRQPRVSKAVPATQDNRGGPGERLCDPATATDARSCSNRSYATSPLLGDKASSFVRLPRDWSRYAKYRWYGWLVIIR